MDFLVTIFRSGFSGLDFSVIIFGSAIFLTLMVQAVFLLTASVDMSEGEQTPRWALVCLLISPLILGALGYGLYLTS